MTASPLLLRVAILAALAVAEAGCAARPARPSSPGGVGVPSTLLEAAHRLGYTAELDDGKVVYCQHETQTGSMVPQEHCIDEAALEADIATQQEALDELKTNRGATSRQMTSTP